MAQIKTLDITPAKIQMPVIEVSQFDIGRDVIIHMKDGSDWYDLTGLTVKLQGTKPSGFGYSVTGTVDGHDVTFSTIYDMTSESGFILSEVSIIDGTDVIGSQNVMLHVEASPHPPEIVDGSPETILPEMRELVNRAEAAAEILLDCSAIATTLPTGASATASYSPETGVFSFGLPRGAKGETGDTGETGNGISNIRKTSTSGLVDTYTITYTDGTSTTFTVTNGQNGTGSVADVTQNGVSVLDGTVAKVVADANVQSDWNESDSTDDAYIKNKPSIPTATSDLTNDSNFVSDSDYVHTDNNYTSTEKTKLSGIASGAEVNVQSNWNETDSTADAYIANKPDIESLKTLVVTVPSFSSLPTTFYDSRINGDHVVNNWYLGTPSAMTGDHWDITTGTGQLTITGSISGSTTLTLHLGLKQAEEEE
jgi:hypothetical protein